MNLFEDILKDFSFDPAKVLVDLIVIAIIILTGRLFVRILVKNTTKAIEKAKKLDDRAKSKQVITSMTLVRSIGRYILYFVMIAMILYRLGFGTFFNNLVMTAGIGTLAISFGAQSVVKDVVTGLFLLFEKQFQVGDYVKIDGYEGTVMAVDMRVTTLQSGNGQTIIIPNGSISSVVNYSVAYSVATVVIPTPYEEDTRKIMKLLEEVAEKYYKENTEAFLEKPSVLGVSAFNASDVELRITAKCPALRQWKVERDLRLLVKENFDQNHISMPYQTIVVENKNEE